MAMKKLLPILLFGLCGCTSPISKLAKELKNDPATVDVQIQSPWGYLKFHRAFPTNWMPVGGP